MSMESVVHIIDDDDAARDATAFLLSTAGFCVRTYPSAVSFLDQLAGLDFGCIVSDVRMPEITGLELLRRLKAQKIDWPTIMITGDGEVGLAAECIKSGAFDFIPKPYEADELLDAVGTALAPDGNARAKGNAILKERLEALSPIEKRVLAGLADGQPNSAIAFALAVGIRTVEICRANILTKTEAKTLSHLVRVMVVQQYEAVPCQPVSPSEQKRPRPTSDRG
jgi:two-component system response regulator FixJ